MKLREIETACNENDLASLASFPSPEAGLPRSSSPTTTFRCAQAVMDAWKRLACGQIEVPTDVPDADGGKILSEEELWNRCFLVLGAYSDSLMARLQGGGLPPGEALPPGIHMGTMDALADLPISPEYTLVGRMVLNSYVGLYLSYPFIGIQHEEPLRAPGAVLESLLHRQLARLHEYERTAPYREFEFSVRGSWIAVCELWQRSMKTRWSPGTIRGTMGPSLRSDSRRSLRLHAATSLL